MFGVPNADKEELKGSALTTVFLATEFFKSAVIRGSCPYHKEFCFANRGDNLIYSCCFILNRLIFLYPNDNAEMTNSIEEIKAEIIRAQK